MRACVTYSAGTLLFCNVVTIELSADGPMRPPYAVYMQGGLNYSHVKIVLREIFEKVSK